MDETFEILQEILERIDSEILESLDDGGDDWFTAETVNNVKDIIKEYLQNSTEK